MKNSFSASPMRALLVVIPLLFAAPATAVLVDRQIWTNAAAIGAINGDLLGLAEVSIRFTDGASRLGVTDTKAALGWRVGPRMQAFAGYGFVRQRRLGASSDEHRLFQQASYVAIAGKHVQLLGRTRLEQRWVVDDPFSLRLRQQMRFVVPVADDGLAVTAAGELFITLTGIGSVGEEFDQFRGSVALRLPVTPRLSLDLGYQGQRRESPARHNDILLLQANYTF